MKLPFDKEFQEICHQIKRENKTVEDWSLIESDDLIQSQNYEGGFDSTEMEFCFSYYDPNRNEYWFQISLDEAKRISNGEKLYLQLREAE